MNTNELWQAVLGELELKLSKANFTTWFKNTFIARVEEAEIVIGVPNTFTKTWLEKKYHKDILDLLQNRTPHRIRSIQYRVEGQPGEAQMIAFEEQEQPQQEESFASYVSSLPQTQTTQTGELSLNPKYLFNSLVFQF